MSQCKWSHMSWLLLAVPMLAVASPEATPGEWEVTTSMNMHGPHGDMNMPAMTHKTCIKPEDAKNLQKQFSNGPHGQGDQNNHCKIIDQSTSGDTIKFHMKCEGQHSAEISGQVTYGTDSYHGHTDIDADGPQGKMHMSNDFSAKRVGGC